MGLVLWLSAATFAALAAYLLHVRSVYAKGMGQVGPKSGDRNSPLSIPFQALNAISDLFGLRLFLWSRKCVALLTAAPQHSR